MSNDLPPITLPQVRRTDFRRPVHCLLGLPIDVVGMAEALARIRSAAETCSPCWVSTANSHFLSTAQHDREFRDSVILSELSVIDGKPLVWMSWLLGLPISERVAGADLFDALIRGEGGALNVYFFGGRDGVAEMACRRINSMGGPLTCVGYTSPGFGSLDDTSKPEYIRQINGSGADILVVALGAKKGQAWIERNRTDLRVPVVSHLGAVLDFVAGTVARAPRWMQNVGLEWLWRIKEDPPLWQRYWIDAKLLLPLVTAQVLRRALHCAARALDGARMPPGLDMSPDGSGWSAERGRSAIRLKLSGSWSEEDTPRLREAFRALALTAQDIQIDVHALGTVHETFVALLMLLYGHQRKMGCALTFSSPSTALRRTLKLHRAEFLLGESTGH